MARTLLSLLIVSLLCFAAKSARGDGGAIQAMTRAGTFQISVFASPTPLVAGPVDLSILVQDAETLSTIEAAEVSLTITPHERPYGAETHPATRELATNKLFRDCHVELAAGRHDVEVRVQAGKTRETIALQIDVGPPPTRAGIFWPWFTWPVVPLAFLLVHVYLAGRRTRPNLPTIIAG